MLQFYSEVFPGHLLTSAQIDVARRLKDGWKLIEEVGYWAYVLPDGSRRYAPGRSIVGLKKRGLIKQIGERGAYRWVLADKS